MNAICIKKSGILHTDFRYAIIYDYESYQKEELSEVSRMENKFMMNCRFSKIISFMKVTLKDISFRHNLIKKKIRMFISVK